MTKFIIEIGLFIGLVSGNDQVLRYVLQLPVSNFRCYHGYAMDVDATEVENNFNNSLNDYFKEVLLDSRVIVLA